MMGAGYGAALQAVGGILQGIAAARAKKEMGKAFNKELDAQGRYRTEGFGEVQSALPNRGSEYATESVARGADKRNDYFQEVGQTRFGDTGPSQRDQAAFDLSAQSRANLGGWSDYAIENMINSIRTQDQLNRISNFSQGDAAIFPAKMYDAQHSNDEMAFWGQLISSIGGGASTFSSLYGGAPVQPGVGQTYLSGIGNVPMYDAPMGYGGQFNNQV